MTVDELVAQIEPTGSESVAVGLDEGGMVGPAVSRPFGHSDDPAKAIVEGAKVDPKQD